MAELGMTGGHHFDVEEARRLAQGEADRRKTAAQRKREVVARIVRVAFERCYPGESVIPATEGGMFFRELAGRTGLDERTLSHAAKELGLWPWTPDHVSRAWSTVHAQVHHTFICP